MCVTTDQDERTQHLKVRDSELSYIESKSTTREVTAEQVESDLCHQQSKQSAAAPREIALEKKEIQKRIKSPSDKLSASAGQKNLKSGQAQSNTGDDKTTSKVDYIVNKNWSDLIPNLDDAGIPTNKTVINLLKMYSPEQVRGA
jgi:sRNA-binding carbon storage regulator CsrA